MSEFVNWVDLARGAAEVSAQTLSRATHAVIELALHRHGHEGVSSHLRASTEPTANVIHMDRYEDEAYAEADLFLHKDGA